jgi:hypothetical protein
MTTYQVDPGGLMRCCLATLDEHMKFMDLIADSPKDGDLVLCAYNCNNGGMIFRDGVWKWNRPEGEQR